MDKSEIIHHAGGGVSLVGRDAVALMRARVLQSALRMYARTGMKANTAYTPTRMLAAASSITGKKYKRGAYLQAADDLGTWADVLHLSLPESVEGKK